MGNDQSRKNYRLQARANAFGGHFCCWGHAKVGAMNWKTRVNRLTRRYIRTEDRELTKEG